MEFTGKIHVRELEQKTVEIKGNQSEPWVQRMLEKAAPEPELTGLEAPQWAQKAEFQTQLRVEKMSGDYIVSGELKAKLQAPCSRCGDLFETPRSNQFQVVLHPLTGRREEKQDEDSGDADYVFFKGDYVNLTELLAEQLIVLEPVAECPRRKDDGSCSLCGLNPQFDVDDRTEHEEFTKSARQEAENKAFSAFSDLRNLKTNRENKSDS